MSLEAVHSSIELCLDNTFNQNNLTPDVIAYDKGLALSLSQVIGIKSLTQAELVTLVSPLNKGRKLYLWCKNTKWETIKRHAQRYLNNIDLARKKLRSSSEIFNPILLFLIYGDVDAEKLLKEPVELKRYFNDAIHIKAQNSELYSSDYLIKYAIHSLFEMAEKIGLKYEGKPYEVHQFIDVITSKNYPERNKDAYHYKHNNFLKMFGENNNVIHRFIYNPLCKETHVVLRGIKLKRNLQAK